MWTNDRSRPPGTVYATRRFRAIESPNVSIDERTRNEG